MARLDAKEIADGLTSLYQAKQDLAFLDDALNTQAASIMAQAQADVQMLRDRQLASRTEATLAIRQAEDWLNKGK